MAEPDDGHEVSAADRGGMGAGGGRVSARMRRRADGEFENVSGRFPTVRTRPVCRTWWGICGSGWRTAGWQLWPPCAARRCLGQRRGEPASRRETSGTAPTVGSTTSVFACRGRLIDSPGDSGQDARRTGPAGAGPAAQTVPNRMSPAADRARADAHARIGGVGFRRKRAARPLRILRGEPFGLAAPDAYTHESCFLMRCEASRTEVHDRNRGGPESGERHHCRR